MSTNVTVTEQHNRVIVEDGVVRVVSVGVPGPPGSSAPAPWFDVQDYGGSWDGIGDDSAAIQAAIDASESVGGFGTVYLPLGGIVRLESTLTINAPVTIMGNQSEIVLAVPAFRAASDNVTIDGGRFYAATEVPEHLIKRHEGEGDYSGWTIRNCYLENVAVRLERFGRMGADGVVKTMGTGVAAHSRIEHCELKNYASNYAIAIGGTTDITIDSCYIHDCGVDVNTGDGIKILDGARDTRIVNTTIEDVTRDCIDIYDATGVTITGCTLNRAGAQAIDAKFTVDDPSDTSFNIVSNNRSRDCASGFNLSVHRTLIMGNVCETSGGYGFRVAHASGDSSAPASQTTVANNIAVECASSGYLFSQGDKLTVLGNQAYNNGGWGVAIASVVSDSRFIGNVAEGNVSGDIQHAGGTNQYLGNRGASIVDDGIRLPNNTRIRMQETNGTVRDVMYMTTGNTFNLGNSNNSMSLLGAILYVFGEMRPQGAVRFQGPTLGFYNTAPIAKPTVSGSTGNNEALESLISALASLGLITDSTSA